jgi:hypothetical protein
MKTEAEIIAEQVTAWRKEVARLNDLIATATQEPDAQAAPEFKPEFNSIGIAKNWSVTVEVDSEHVLCIHDQGYAGLPHLEPFEETIESCARHLLGFIGRPVAAPLPAAPAPTEQAGELPPLPERERFVETMKELFGEDENFDRDDNGCYINRAWRDAYVGWIHRAALAARQAPAEPPTDFLMPADAWNEYATRSGLLNERGVAPDPAKTQTAYFAYMAAWNRLHEAFSAYIAERRHLISIGAARQVGAHDASIARTAAPSEPVRTVNFGADGPAQWSSAARTAVVSEGQAVAVYECPAGCGCLWRDNGDGTMSLLNGGQKSCAQCESMPLASLNPLMIADHLFIGARDDGFWHVCVEKVFKTEDEARTACRKWKSAYNSRPAAPAPAAPPLPPPELTWLYTHCRAIGMDCKSDSGKWEHDIALFTIRQKAKIEELERLATPATEQAPAKDGGEGAGS